MNERLIGLMSGTSLDGVDAVLVRFDEQGAPRVEADHFLAYPPRLREQALALQARGDNELDRAARLANELAELYAQAVNGLLAAQALAPADIAAVACHGQTIRHAPDAGYTWQAGNMARLAELTGIDVIADFRSRDLAAGGQGAPCAGLSPGGIRRAAARPRDLEHRRHQQSDPAAPGSAHHRLRLRWAIC